MYDANGGQNTSRGFRQSEHLLSRYSPENQYFNRNGSLFQKGLHTAWMEYQADGSGQAVGLGSRIAWKAGLVLYAQWTPWTDEADFIYKKVSGFAVITGYSGKAQQICIPPSLGGLPVRTIRENAFADIDVQLKQRHDLIRSW